MTNYPITDPAEPEDAKRTIFLGETNDLVLVVLQGNTLARLEDRATNTYILLDKDELFDLRKYLSEALNDEGTQAIQ